MTLVHHHIKYKEIHGEDVVILMDKSEHAKLHVRLRKEGKCRIPPEELHAMSVRARSRADYDDVKDRVKKQYQKCGEGRIIQMRIYNTYNGGYSIVPRLRPDIISLAIA